MDADNTMKLPLTTTKRGIDATSDLYKVALVYMKESMLTVIQFLRKVTKLIDANDYRKLIGDQASKITVVEIKRIEFDSEKRRFLEPELDMETIAQKKDTVRIAYDTNKNDANTVRLHSNSKTLKELGLLTFNYYKQMEGLDNE